MTGRLCARCQRWVLAVGEKGASTGEAPAGSELLVPPAFLTPPKVTQTLQCTQVSAHATLHPQPLPNPTQVLGAPLPYNSIDDVRRRLADVAPHFGRRDAVEAPLWLNGEYFKVRIGAWGGRVGWVGG